MFRALRGHVRSNVVGYVAVFLALSGVAVALPGKNSVNSGDIINETIGSVDVKNGKLRLADVAVLTDTVSQNFGTVAANSCQSTSKDVSGIVKPTDYVLVQPPPGGGDEDFYGGATTANGGPPPAADNSIELRVCNPTNSTGVNLPAVNFRVLVFR